jgi:putative SOS response-associated peptidase YedK
MMPAAGQFCNGAPSPMCGRYTLQTPAATLARILGIPVPEFRVRFNIAPSQDVAVVRLSPSKQLTFGRLRWGLVPPWAGEGAQGQINARCETAAKKPSFRGAFRDRRCLVLADGFYEWKKMGARKQPYYIRLRDESPFAFAGLWGLCPTNASKR